MAILYPKNFILDVDGVMTDGSFIYSEKGKIYKKFGAHDHDGIKMLKNFVNIMFVTADSSGFAISRKRIEYDMKQKLMLLKETDRLAFLDKYYELEKCIYMGDGYHDAAILKRCLFGIAPASARIEAKKAADYVTPSRGGDGAVLDACLKIKELFFSEKKDLTASVS